MTEWDATGGSGFIDPGVTNYQSLRHGALSNGESSGILRQACQDVFICLRPSKSSTRLPGRTDGFQERAHRGRYVFLSIYVLLNLFLSSMWDWTLAEKWLADKKEEEKVSFVVCVCVCSGNPPAASCTALPWKHTGRFFCVFGPLYGVWTLKLFIITSQVCQQWMRSWKTISVVATHKHTT